MMNDHDKKTLHLKIAAHETLERATVAYYTDSGFHKESLADSVKRLKLAIAEYEKESE
jgi:hypothetical protein